MKPYIPRRTTPNPAFKIAQPLPRLTADLPAARQAPAPFGIPGPHRWAAGESKYPPPAPYRRPHGEGAQPRA
jgi:hypothetical protein